MDATRPCIYCGQMILAEAHGCRFCGKMQTGTAPAPQPQPAGSNRTCAGCGALFPAGSARCPFCGDDINGQPAVSPAMPTPAVATPDPGMPKPKGDTALILGLVSLVGAFICVPLLLLGPFAWSAGSKYEAQCRVLGFEPESNGKTGKILGMIATGILGLGLLVLVGMIALGVFASTRAHGLH